MKVVSNMIDMHTHVLPGIDDGAANIEESIEMLKESARQGVSLCVASSHIHPTDSHVVQEFLQKRQQAYSELVEACAGLDVPDIILGAEVHMDRDISEVEGIEKLCIGDTRFMLVEFPFLSSPGPDCAEWLYNLNLKGITPIIAHIDRYSYFNDLIDDISGVKVIYQINNMRAYDFWGRRSIKKLLATGYMVVMASDMHNTGIRACDMKKTYDILKKKMPDWAEMLLGGNAKILLDI